jgi:hypothetical protein
VSVVPRGRPGQKPIRIDRQPWGEESFVVKCCEIHGEMLHDSRENDFCWCEK